MDLTGLRYGTEDRRGKKKKKSKDIFSELGIRKLQEVQNDIQTSQG